MKESFYYKNKDERVTSKTSGRVILQPTMAKTQATSTKRLENFIKSTGYLILRTRILP